MTLGGIAGGGFTFAGGSSTSTLSIASMPFPPGAGGIIDEPIVIPVNVELTASVHAIGDAPTLALLDTQVQRDTGGGAFNLSATLTPSDLPFQSVPVGNAPDAVATADFNGDGVPDLIIADQGSDQVSILLNDSTPGGAIVFHPGQRLSSFGAGTVATAVDFPANGGPPLLLITNRGSNNVTMLQGVLSPPGSFSETIATRQTFDVGIAPIESFVVYHVTASISDATLVDATLAASDRGSRAFP